MFLKSYYDEQKHRNNKRQLEIKIITKLLNAILKENFQKRNIKILEFGSGTGYQISYLENLGHVVASDIYIHPNIEELQKKKFVKCSISDAPFKDNKFDIIFSNHVLEHIADLDIAFTEMKRIGTQGCYYVFAVPTNVWLLISGISQYVKKIRSIKNKLFQYSKLKKNNTTNGLINNNKSFTNSTQKNTIFNKVCNRLIPKGHGIQPEFIECYKSFRIKSWKSFFSNNGFSIVVVKPLLLYGPSECPIIPTTTYCNKYFCSSVLFILEKSS